MFFVIDKPRLQRIIAIVRDDRTPRAQGTDGPYMRMEAREGTLGLAGHQVKATFPATVYEPGVLFLRITAFRRLLRDIKGSKALAIQVTGDGLMMDNIVMPLEPNEMMLYPDPDRAPARCPLEPDPEPPAEPGLMEPNMPLFDLMRPDGQPDAKWQELKEEPSGGEEEG
jgi:hypothetical protein